jgi:hypothetical protein
MPLEAKRVFCELFHRIQKRRQKRVLIHLCSRRYGIAPESVQTLGYRDPRDFGAPSKAELKKLPKIDSLTPAILELRFGSIHPLKAGGDDQ